MYELFASELRGDIQTVFAVVICLAALLWGSGPERIIAASWLTLFEILTPLYVFLSGGLRLESVDWLVASLDIVAGVIWIIVAIYANRNYTLWIAGLQLLAILAHFARAFADVISPIAYISMVVVPGWIQLVVLSIGLFRHVLRKRQYGAYRDWRTSPKVDQLAASGSGLMPLGSMKNRFEDPISWRDDLK